MRNVPILLLLVFATPFANAQCVAHSDAQRTHVVELYTSEGCSSCPPADRWLGQLQDDAHVIPLAFHVDYWDSSSWKDRFADPRFTARQRALAAQSKSSVVYTPEVALDGREWREWSAANFPAAENTAMKLALTVEADASFRARLNVDGVTGDGRYAVYFALSENGLSSRVVGGENSGVHLRHEHVVRTFVGPLAPDRAEATLIAPAELDRAKTDVVAFVQHVDDGAIVGAVRLPMAQCAVGAPD